MAVALLSIVKVESVTAPPTPEASTVVFDVDGARTMTSASGFVPQSNVHVEPLTSHPPMIVTPAGGVTFSTYVPAPTKMVSRPAK